MATVVPGAFLGIIRDFGGGREEGPHSDDQLGQVEIVNFGQIAT